MAVPQTSKRFLIAWRTLADGISGRFVDLTGTPISGIMPLAPPAAVVLATATRRSSGMPRPMTSGWWRRAGARAGALASFRRIRASDGYVWPVMQLCIR